MPNMPEYTDEEETGKVNFFLVCWCNEGLECVLPFIDPAVERTFIALGGQGVPNHALKYLHVLIMRAKCNTQRHYEIYSVTAVDGIDENDIREMFENAPQEAADTIRRLGVRLYSDRADPGRYKIT